MLLPIVRSAASQKHLSLMCFFLVITKYFGHSPNFLEPNYLANYLPNFRQLFCHFSTFQFLSHLYFHPMSHTMIDEFLVHEMSTPQLLRCALCAGNGFLVHTLTLSLTDYLSTLGTVAGTLGETYVLNATFCANTSLHPAAAAQYSASVDDNTCSISSDFFSSCSHKRACQLFEPMSTIGTSDEYCTSIPSKTGLQSVPRDHKDTTEPESRAATRFSEGSESRSTPVGVTIPPKGMTIPFNAHEG